MTPYTYENYHIDKNSTKRIHYIVGTMLYYAQSVDPIMLQAINENLRVQSRSTRKTAERERMLLDYATMYLNTILSYKAIDMFLHVDSDATYLTMPEAMFI